jgi:hypothetical protein
MKKTVLALVLLAAAFSAVFLTAFLRSHSQGVQVGVVEQPGAVSTGDVCTANVLITNSTRRTVQLVGFRSVCTCTTGTLGDGRALVFPCSVPRQTSLGVLVAVTAGMVVSEAGDGTKCETSVHRLLAGAFPGEDEFIVVLVRCGCVACETNREGIANEVAWKRLRYPNARIVQMTMDCGRLDATGYSIEGADDVVLGKEAIAANCQTPQIFLVRRAQKLGDPPSVPIAE